MSDPDPIPFDNSFDNSPDIPPAPRHSGIRYLAVVLFLGLVGVAGFLGAPYLKEFFRSPSPPVASTRKATENETVFQKPPLAPDPSRYAGIEIGGSAVKFVILRAIPKNGKVAFDVLEKKDLQTSTILLKDDKLQKGLLQGAAREVAWIFFDRVVRQGGVLPEHVRLVASSAYAELSDRNELDKELQAALREPEKYGLPISKGTGVLPNREGLGVHFITIHDELTHLIRGLGKGEEGQSCMVDIGSGNVKCGYFIEEGPTTLGGYEVLSQGPLGAKRLAGAAGEKSKEVSGANFLRRLHEVAATKVGEPLQETVEAKPGLKNRQRYFLLGGTVWALTTLLYPESVAAEDDLVPLTVEDIRQYQELVTTLSPDGRLRFPDVDLKRLADAGLRERVEKEISHVARDLHARTAGGRGLHPGHHRR